MHTIEELIALIATANKRAAELPDLIKNEKDSAKLEALSAEAKKVVEDRAAYQAELDEKRRNAALSAIASNPIVPANPAAIPEIPHVTNRRSAVSLAVGLLAMHKAPTDEQKRALNTALTTTDIAYVAPTADVNGVNNAGIFIQTSVVLDLLREEKKLTPLLQDILFTSVAGLTIFPYRESRSKSQAKAEGKGTGTASWKWSQISGVKGWLQLNVDISDEAIFLTPFDLGAYILSQMIEDLTYDWAAELIYGIGGNDSDGVSHVSGVVHGLTAKTYAAGKELDGIAAGIIALPAIYFRGAKIYLSRTLANKIYLTKNSNGDYVLPILNAGVGINSVINVPAAIDDTLNDGDYVVGNVGSNFKANLLSPMNSEKTHDQNKHIWSYNVSVFACTIAVPGAFVYGAAA